MDAEAREITEGKLSEKTIGTAQIISTLSRFKL